MIRGLDSRIYDLNLEETDLFWTNASWVLWLCLCFTRYRKSITSSAS